MAFSNPKKKKKNRRRNKVSPINPHSIFPTQNAIESDEQHSIWHPKVNFKKHAEKPKLALLIMPFITRGKIIKKERISSHLRFSIGMASSDVGSTAAAAVAAASKVLVLSTATHLKGFLHTKPPFLFTVTTPEEAEERKSESLRREQIGNDDAAVMLTSKVRDDDNDDDDDEALLTNNTEDAAAAIRALPETRAATESMTKNTTEKRPKNKGGEKQFKNQNKKTFATRLAICGHEQQTGKGKKKTRAWRRDS
jgi:hypothetical protein